MPIFYLTIQPTFYERGFFNVTVDFDRFVRREEGPVTLTLKLGLKSENIEAELSANLIQMVLLVSMGTRVSAIGLKGTLSVMTLSLLI